MDAAKDQETILIIDDEVNLLQGIRRRLHKQYAMKFAPNGAKGIEIVQAEGNIAVVICDMNMPGQNGIEVLGKIAEISPNTVRIMLTGQADMATAVDAINHGNIFRFFTKPCSIETLTGGIDAALQQYRLITSERDLLDNTLSGSINLLTDILAMVDPDSFGRAEKARRWCRAIAEQLNLQSQMWKFELATMLSPIGLAALPPEVAKKAREGSEMSDVEQEMTSATVEVAHKLIDNIPRLAEVATCVRYQGKNFDGSGAPNDGLGGSDLPVGARIVRILNDLVAAQQRGTAPEEMLQSMAESEGIYDPKLLAIITPIIIEAERLEALANLEMIEIKVSELMTGDVIQSPIVDLEQDTLVLAVGTVMTEIYLERLLNLRKLRPVTELVSITRPSEPEPLAVAS